MGYNTLRGLKRKANVESGVALTGSAASAGIAGYALRNGKLKPKLAAAAAVPAAAGLFLTGRSMERASGLESRMYKIRAKAHERAANGEYGKGRVRKEATAADYQRYLTRSERLQTAGQAGAGLAASLGTFGASSVLLNSALKDQRAARAEAERIAEGRRNNAGAKALRRGPREVKARWNGVYDIRGVEPKPVMSLPRRLSRRGNVKAGVAAGLLAVPVAAGVNNAMLSRRNEKLIRQRKKDAVGKADREFTVRQRQLEGAGLAAGGVGLAAAATNTGRIVGGYERAYGKYLDRRMNTAKGRKKSELGAAAKKLRNMPRRNMRRIGFAGAGFAAAAPMFWVGGRRVVEKKLDQYDFDAGMAGGLAAAGGYQLANYGTNPLQARQEKKFPAEAKAKREVYAARTFGTDRRGKVNYPPSGDPKWKKYNRNYPLGTGGKMKLGPVTMDYGKYRRVYSRLQGGKTQVAITTGRGVAGGLAAMKANRRYDPVEGRQYKYKRKGKE